MVPILGDAEGAQWLEQYGTTTIDIQHGLPRHK